MGRPKKRGYRRNPATRSKQAIKDASDGTDLKVSPSVLAAPLKSSLSMRILSLEEGTDGLRARITALEKTVERLVGRVG